MKSLDLRWLAASVFVFCALALLLHVPQTSPDLAQAAPFSSHMLQHMTLVVIAAPMLVLALPKLAAGCTVSPLIASLVEFVVVWGWHLPALHIAAAESFYWSAFELASFLFAGMLVWASVLRRGESLAGIGGLLLTSMHMTLLGALLILSPQLLYGLAAHVGHAGHVAPALGPIEDQQLGGMIMLGIGTPAYLLAALWLLARVLRDDTNEEVLQ